MLTTTMTDTDALALTPEMLLGQPDHHLAAPAATAPSRRARWAGRIISGLAVLFLTFDCTIKVLQLAPAMSGTSQLGYPTSAVLGIGIVELICLAVYLIPRTSVLGAILLTGYLGGAIATHVRVGSPLATHVLFPIYVAALIWGGLFLRDLRVRALVRRAP
jgi:hypothetical protein